MAEPDATDLRPDKIAVWPGQDDREESTSPTPAAPATPRADLAHQTINANGMNATFREELGDMWTVPLGPSPATQWASSSSAIHSRSHAPSSEGGTGHGRADARDGRSP
jgi:hypothetical protein